MAGELQIARRYADAYFALAKQAKDIPGWGTALENVAAILGDPTVLTALGDPRRTRRDRAQLVVDLLRDVPAPARNLARLLAERGRVAVLPLVVERYNHLADREAGVLRAEVLTALPVSPSLEKTISRRLTEQLGGEVQTTVTQDPSILGGLVIRIGDRVIDGSVRTRLQALQAALA